jgi:hypothetical protein
MTDKAVADLAEVRRHTKTHENPHMGQYAPDLHYPSEYHYNMNGGTSEMIGMAHKMGHKQMVLGKAIDSVALTERRESQTPRVDVTKNFSRLPKTFNDPQPNDAGEPVTRQHFKKNAPAGTNKGGLKYGK